MQQIDDVYISNVLNEQNKRVQRERVRVLMKGNENVQPFHQQEPHLINPWLKTLRNQHESILNRTSLDSFWTMLVEEGICKHLLYFMHGDASNDTGSTDNYPAYAAEVMYLIVLRVGPKQLKSIYDEYFVNGKGLEILNNCMRNGFCTVKRYCYRILNTLMIRTPIARDGTLFDHKKSHGIIDTLLSNTKDNYELLVKELQSDEGCHQVSLILPGSKLKEAITYAPRFMAMIHDTLASTISMIVSFNTDNRSILFSHPKLVECIVENASIEASDAYPEGRIQYHYTSALSCLCHVSSDSSDTSWRDHLVTLTKDIDVTRILDLLYTMRQIDDLSSNCARKFSNVSNYGAPTIPTTKDVAEALNYSMLTELAVLDSLASLSQVDSIAQKLYTYRDGWLFNTTKEILFEESPHDSVRRKYLQEGGQELLIQKAFNPQNTYSDPYLSYHPQHLSLTFDGCAIVLYNNLQSLDKSEKQKENNKIVSDKLKSSVNHLRQLAKKCEDDVTGEYYLNLALRILQTDSRNTLKRLKSDVLYGRAEIYVSQKKYLKAQTDLEQCLSLERTHTKARSLLQKVKSLATGGLSLQSLVFLLIVVATIIWRYLA
jgi:tetratricopeptide (TPR) repeat protein